MSAQQVGARAYIGTRFHHSANGSGLGSPAANPALAPGEVASQGVLAVPQAHFSVPAAMSTTLSPSCQLRHAPLGWEKARLLESMTF
jgi:hypothetical protein